MVWDGFILQIPGSYVFLSFLFFSFSSFFFIKTFTILNGNDKTCLNSFWVPLSVNLKNNPLDDRCVQVKRMQSNDYYYYCHSILFGSSEYQKNYDGVLSIRSWFLSHLSPYLVGGGCCCCCFTTWHVLHFFARPQTMTSFEKGQLERFGSQNRLGKSWHSFNNTETVNC